MHALREAAMKRPEVPSWFNAVPETSLCSSRDVAEIFGYTSAVRVNQAVYQGSFPPPDTKINCGKKRFPRCQWTIATLRKEIARRSA